VRQRRVLDAHLVLQIGVGGVQLGRRKSGRVGVCPFDAITMGNDYELSDYHRSDLIFTKEMLLAEPLERSPIRAEGE